MYKNEKKVLSDKLAYYITQEPKGRNEKSKEEMIKTIIDGMIVIDNVDTTAKEGK